MTAVGAGTILPLGGLGALNDFAVEGAPPPPPDVNQEIAVASVTPDYFKAIGTPLQRGRLFTALDHAEGAAGGAASTKPRRGSWFPNQDPIGRRVLVGRPPREVVGIVGDVLAAHARTARRAADVPALRAAHQPHRSASSCAPRRSAGARAGGARADPRARSEPAARRVRCHSSEMVSRSVARPRFYTSLLTLFAAVALALSATGIFGVMSYTVAQQSKEIGIRMALGARTADVLRSVVGRAVALAGLGVIAGIIAALALGGFIRNQLFGVTSSIR